MEVIYSRRKLGQKLEDPQEKLFYQNNIYHNKKGIFHLTPREILAREIVYRIIIIYFEHKEYFEEINFSGTITSTLFRKVIAHISRVLHKEDPRKKPIFWDDRVLFYKTFLGLCAEGTLGSFSRRGIGQPAWIIQFRAERCQWIMEHPFVYKELAKMDWKYLFTNVLKIQEQKWAAKKEEIYKKYPHLIDRDSL